jgi:2-succinyl-5-enolpyruvyl-6-hydroxy-3-cyclohexene-1-carboxylate synthase
LGIDTTWRDEWVSRQQETKEASNSALSEMPYGEIKVFSEVLKALPENSVLHLGNSLPVRYGSLIPFVKAGIKVYSNRGTSGIDGCLSAAAGHSMVNDGVHTLILGDLSFMYDSNGLWNKYLRPNLKIIIFNNRGGGIFRTIPGPSTQPELETYFAAGNDLSFEHTALQHGCRYIACENLEKTGQALEQLYRQSDSPVILEFKFSRQPDVREFRRKLKV